MFKIFSFLIALVFCISACQPSDTNTTLTHNTLSAQEQEEGWQLLFDGETTKGWHLYNMGDTLSAWMVTEAGELYCNPDTFDLPHGDLLTDATYENYELKFEWKITEAGNSGVFVNVREGEQYPTAWTTGPEYQLLDNLGIHPEYLEDRSKGAGCLYGFKPPVNEVKYKPAGEWNESRIVQKDGVVEFWLNGIQTAIQDLTSPEWKEMIAQSGFKYYEDYGTFTTGHIALQDWSKGVWFRNIKLREM